MSIRYVYAGPNSWLPDLKDLNELLRQLNPYGKFEEINQTELLRSFENPRFFLLCALIEKDGGETELAGIGSIFFQKNLGRWIAEIHDIVVSDRHRGQGLGKAIVSRLLKVACGHAQIEGRSVKVFLTSRPARTAANKLYETLGFTKVSKASGEWGTNLYKIIADPDGSLRSLKDKSV